MRGILAAPQVYSSTDYESRWSRLLPMLRDARVARSSALRLLCFNKLDLHPEEATKWPSRRMGCNTDL